VEFQGQRYVASQANNMYIFPGVALGAFLGRTRIITEAMLMAAAEKLPELISGEALAAGGRRLVSWCLLAAGRWLLAAGSWGRSHGPFISDGFAAAGPVLSGAPPASLPATPAGQVYPGLHHIRDISTSIALEVIKTAAREGRCKGPALEQLAKGDARLQRWIRRNMFSPRYTSLVNLPVGVGQ
jgi:malic enzyme